MATDQSAKKPRKQRIDWTEAERLKVFVAYLPLYNAIVEKDKKGWKGKAFMQAQSVLPENRQVGETAAVKFFQDFTKAKESGLLDNLEPERHDHRPAAERSFVKKEVTPTAASASASPTTSTAAPAPAPSTEVDPAQMVMQGLTLMMQKAVAESIGPLLTQLVGAINSKMDDQYIRLLEYWDPEAAKQVRDGEVKLPPLEITIGEQSNVIQLAPAPSPAPTPPLKKHKVLIVGGKDDGFWTYLQDVMPECLITFADGHKPRSIPTNKEYDYVLVHWMTSHSARAVIKNYYPEHDYVAKGGQSTVVDMICKNLGIDRRSVRDRKSA